MPRVALALSILLCAGVASAGSGMNPAGRTVLWPPHPSESPARVSAEGTRQALTVNVPLPAGAVQLDSTYYDLQDMGSLGARIVVGTDGRVHVAWQDDFCDLSPVGCPPRLSDPEPYPRRGMGYAYRDPAGTWHGLSKVVDPTIRNCCVTELVGGFGTVAITPDGRAVISQHLNEDGCDLRGDLYLQDAPGGSTYTAYLAPIVSPSYLFPQGVAAPNGSFVLLGEVPLSPPDHFYEEVNHFKVSRLAAAGTHFVCPTGWQFGPWTEVVPSSQFRDGFPAYPCMAVSSNGRVGIAVTDFLGNVYLIESPDGTFAPASRTIRNLTNYSDGTVVQSDSTSAEYRPHIHCHLAYQDTTPHVVWGEVQARKIGSSIEGFDFRSRIRHWSSVRGLSTVKQVQAGEADHYDDVNLGLHGPIAGFNTISVDWPEVGFSPDGSETYVAWLRFVDGEIDPTANAGLPGVVTGIGYGDVACAVARGNNPWSAPQNLTQTPSTDERFFSLAARNPGGTARIVFQASATDQAGVVVIGDRGGSPGNLVRRIAYLERKLGASLVDVGDGSRADPIGLTSYPNPALGRVRFALGDVSGGRESATVLVFSASGRLVARLPIARAGVADWEGRDLAGRVAPSGLYFARLEGDRNALGTKFMLLR